MLVDEFFENISLGLGAKPANIPGDDYHWISDGDERGERLLGFVPFRLLQRENV